MCAKFAVYAGSKIDMIQFKIKKFENLLLVTKINCRMVSPSFSHSIPFL